ncbi:MAG: hypothetical protein U0235_24630 [Polyangiaceae bacterium]
MNARLVPVLALIVSSVACGSNDEPYKPTPAWSGRKASVPAPPAMPSTPIKSGDAYTMYGAVHQLRSRIHGSEVVGKDITLIGYIIDSNMNRAPACAIHKTGKKDPDGCVTEVPTFVLADTKDAKVDDPKIPRIKVMGWASNFANVFDAIEKYKNLKEPPKEALKDELWAVDIPFPLPAVGAKVKVTGRYGVNFGKSSAGLAADPLNGIMTYGKIEVLEPAPEPASLPKPDGKVAQKK